MVVREKGCAFDATARPELDLGGEQLIIPELVSAPGLLAAPVRSTPHLQLGSAMTIPALRPSSATLSRLVLHPSTPRSACAYPRAFTTSASASAKAKQLCGSAPNYDRHLIVLGQPSSSWPSHLESVSPLAKAMGEWFRKPGLGKVGVTFGERDESGRLEEAEVGWDSKQSKFMEPSKEGKEE